MQQHLELIPHIVDAEIVQQRVKDGYINATAMCQAVGRPWSRYWEARASKDYAQALSSALGIPIAELIQSLSGGDPRFQGTWVHPQVAIHLAQWLSPEFAVKVTGWVYDWMSGKSKPGSSNLPLPLAALPREQRAGAGRLLLRAGRAVHHAHRAARTTGLPPAA